VGAWSTAPNSYFENVLRPAPRTAATPEQRRPMSRQQQLLLRLPFAPEASSPGLARAAVSDALGDCPCLDAITLMVSELVTNAILHTGRAAELRVFDLGHGDVRVEVADLDIHVPVPTTVANATGGFGLRIVGAYARAWGTSVRKDGKVVWFEVGNAFETDRR
ncbi:MAG TPA: ATP-binding protein, partial [Acidimicrobiales bacterium]